MNKLLLGRYINGDSLVHGMDARSKLVLSFYFVAIIFLCNLAWFDRFYRAFAGVFHQRRPRLLGFRSAVPDAFWDCQRLLRLLPLRFDHFHVDAFDADDCAA